MSDAAYEQNTSFGSLEDIKFYEGPFNKIKGIEKLKVIDGGKTQPDWKVKLENELEPQKVRDVISSVLEMSTPDIKPGTRENIDRLLKSINPKKADTIYDLTDCLTRFTGVMQTLINRYYNKDEVTPPYVAHYLGQSPEDISDEKNRYTKGIIRFKEKALRLLKELGAPDDILNAPDGPCEDIKPSEDLKLWAKEIVSWLQNLKPENPYIEEVDTENGETSEMMD
ncbi:hypothetical protein ACFL6I_21480 [candidate division KSB1 bacterium]